MMTTQKDGCQKLIALAIRFTLCLFVLSGCGEPVSSQKEYAKLRKIGEIEVAAVLTDGSGKDINFSPSSLAFAEPLGKVLAIDMVHGAVIGGLGGEAFFVGGSEGTRQCCTWSFSQKAFLLYHAPEAAWGTIQRVDMKAQKLATLQSQTLFDVRQIVSIGDGSIGVVRNSLNTDSAGCFVYVGAGFADSSKVPTSQFLPRLVVFEHNDVSAILACGSSIEGFKLSRSPSSELQIDTMSMDAHVLAAENSSHAVIEAKISDCGQSLAILTHNWYPSGEASDTYALRMYSVSNSPTALVVTPVWDVEICNGAWHNLVLDTDSLSTFLTETEIAVVCSDSLNIYSIASGALLSSLEGEFRCVAGGGGVLFVGSQAGLARYEWDD